MAIIIVILILIFILLFKILASNDQSNNFKNANIADLEQMEQMENVDEEKITGEMLDNINADYVDSLQTFNSDKDFYATPLTTSANMPIEFRNGIKYDADLINKQPYQNFWHTEKPCSPAFDPDLYSYHQTDDNPNLIPTYPCGKTPSKHSSGGNLISNISTDEDIYDKMDGVFENIVNMPGNSNTAIQKTNQANMQNSIFEMYLSDGCVGDDEMVRMQLFSGDKSRKSIDNRGNIDKNTLLPYVAEELNDSEHKIWWENEDLDQFM